MGFDRTDDEGNLSEHDCDCEERPEYLQQVDDGCGCVEVWEVVAEKRS